MGITYLHHYFNTSGDVRWHTLVRDGAAIFRVQAVHV